MYYDLQVVRQPTVTNNVFQPVMLTCVGDTLQTHMILILIKYILYDEHIFC